MGNWRCQPLKRGGTPDRTLGWWSSSGRGTRHDPITVHIGLNAGRALVGFTRLRSRSGERWVYAATGPVTDVAARLCALATRGQILTTSATAALLRGQCHCRCLGSHSLKNVTGPVEVVEVGPAKAGAMWDQRRRRRRQND